MEATGETVGEAKWAALRELEKLHPGLDKSAVAFQVVSEGERGLLGVGYAPARVIASVDSESVAAASSPNEAESELAAEVRELIERMTAGIGVRCRIEIVEDDETMTASCSGSNLGLLIGKHGQTIDAIQYLVNAIVWRARPDDRKDVVVDAAGYRERRRAALESLAVRSAEEALATHSPVELEPMTAVERKTVHVRLKEFDGVETGSEGTEPNRYVVISPAAQRPVRASGPVEGALGGTGRFPRVTRGVRDPAAGALAPGSARNAGPDGDRDRDEAWSMLVEDAFRGVETVRELEGLIVDVGSGNGSPGIPLAASLPEREVTLLESSRRKCAFLERVAVEFPNVRVVCGRAEEQETDVFGVATAKALASPPVALEWVLPLVRPGGAAVLWLGPSVDLEQLARVSDQLAGGPPETPRRPRRRAQDRADSRGFSASPGSSPETSSRLITMEGCPGASTPSPTRRVASARRRLP